MRLLVLLLLLAPPAVAALPPAPFCDAATPLPAEPVKWPALERIGAPEGPPPRGWTWVNLWASWCEPCTDEIPRLLAWREKLPLRPRLLFLNVEDDRAAVAAFLKREDAPLKGTAWLPAGPARSEWLRRLGVPADAFLPLQVLVDPDGRVRCVHVGALEEADRPAVEAWMRKALSPEATRASVPR